MIFIVNKITSMLPQTPLDDTLTLINVNGEETPDRGLLLLNGGTVCSNGFSDTSARAACDKLGHTGINGTWRELSYRRWQVRESLEIAVTEMKCPEGTWGSCGYSKDVGSTYCDHYDDIYLDCGSEFSKFCC